MRTMELLDGHNDPAGLIMDVRWLAAGCILARHSGQAKQQILSAFRRAPPSGQAQLPVPHLKVQ